LRGFGEPYVNWFHGKTSLYYLDFLKYYFYPFFVKNGDFNSLLGRKPSRINALTIEGGRKERNGMMYFLGVDGGGTKTAAILMDAQGNVLRTTRKGTGNIAVLDRGSVAQLIRSILQELLPEGDTENIRWATFAFAGAGRPQEREAVTAIIRNTGIRNFTVLSDAEILYYSVFGEEQGILISAGTGSICLVKGKDNQYHQIGGWGYLLGDEGSGFYIGSIPFDGKIAHVLWHRAAQKFDYRGVFVR